MSDRAFDELSAARWAELAAVDGPVPAELVDRPDLIASHAPLAELIAGFASGRVDAVPYLVGVTGGVAAGKSVTAQTIAALLAARGTTVEVVTTDGFLMSNRRLDELGLSARKGFPESYDHAALLAFVVATKSGAVEIEVPLYDHATYDIVADRTQTVRRSDVVILEGLNVLQVSEDGLQVSDLLDFSIYVDAYESDLNHWYHERLDRLWSEARSGAGGPSFYSAFAAMSPAEFTAMAEGVWSAVNHPNLVDHIVPTRPRADLILEKQSDHSVRRVLVRRR